MILRVSPLRFLSPQDWTFAIDLVTLVVLSVTGCVVIPIVCLARAEPKQSSTVVWTTFTNNTGWSDGICFLTGLVTPTFAFGGLDSTMHLVEETKNPRKDVSRAICYTVGMGLVTAFLFTLAMVYCMGNIEDLLATPTGFVSRSSNPVPRYDADRQQYAHLRALDPRYTVDGGWYSIHGAHFVHQPHCVYRNRQHIFSSHLGSGERQCFLWLEISR